MLFFGIINLHQLVVELLTDTELGIFAPFDAGLDIVVDDIAAVVSGHFGIDGKDLDLIAALGADFNFQSRCFQFIRSVASSEHVACLLF